MMNRAEPTGRYRFRIEKRWFKKPLLVLQIEVRWGDGPPDFHGLPKWLAGTGWRDAEVADYWLHFSGNGELKF